MCGIKCIVAFYIGFDFFKNQEKSEREEKL